MISYLSVSEVQHAVSIFSSGLIFRSWVAFVSSLKSSKRSWARLFNVSPDGKIWVHIRSVYDRPSVGRNTHRTTTEMKPHFRSTPASITVLKTVSCTGPCTVKMRLYFSYRTVLISASTRRSVYGPYRLTWVIRVRISKKQVTLFV